MKRKIVDQLKAWKQSANRMPLIVHGARQVGKTYTLLEFGRNYFSNTVYVNFEDSQELARIFERDLNPDRILLELSALTGQSITPNETLLFFDEIQACQRALTSLKYFCEQAPQYAIVAAGSLLGVALNRQQASFPVGKVTLMSLFPLDFEEFLWAIGQERLAELIREHDLNHKPFSLHDTAMDFYRLYVYVGGMPRPVLEYHLQKDFNLVTAAHKTISDTYIADMTKYAQPSETNQILAAYRSIPAQLIKKNHKFQYKIIKSGARSHTYELPLEWLSTAGIIIKCTRIEQGKLPLTAFADYTDFKAYLSDTGLLCTKFEIPEYAALHGRDSFNDFKGSLAENYVAAALTANGRSCWYWSPDQYNEVEFVIQNSEGEIIPIEVKSGENVSSKSFEKFRTLYKPSYGIRISGKNFGFENGIKSVPLYAVFCAI